MTIANGISTASGVRPPPPRPAPDLGSDPGALLGLVADGLAERWAADDTELLGRICHYALVPGGKMFRPALLLESAAAVGGDPRAVLPAAVGAESGHVASLVHDDIIDGDDLRRGRASVQHRFGVDDAIVAGDALIFDLFLGLSECRWTGVPEANIVAALQVVAACGIDLCRGQSMEAEICRDMRFDAQAYLEMAGLKTAAFFRGACASGAVLAGGPPDLVDALGRYALHLGRAFQIQDDVLAFASDTETMGKAASSDARNGRLTLPVILAHDITGPAGRARIRHALCAEPDPERARDALVAEVGDTGALRATERSSRREASAARAALDVLPASPSRDRLARLADAVIDRSS